MINSRIVANNILSTDVSITFHVEDEFGKLYKFVKTLTNIKDTASYEDIYEAANAISKLYEHTSYDVKLITTNLIQKDHEENLKKIVKEEEITTVEEGTEVDTEIVEEEVTDNNLIIN